MILRKLARYCVYAVKYAAAFIVLPLEKKKDKNKNLWIIAERGTDARDNAYHLFCYIRKNHPEINIAYVITKQSTDRDKVARLGRVINFGSFEHYVAMAVSPVKISTHIMGFSPNINFFIRLNKLGLVNGKKIFLQHGIIKDNLTYLYYENTGIDLFVCSAKPEIEYIRKNYGYPDGILELLGLCRYDALEASTEKSKKVLLMPTWRASLQQSGEKEFLDSDYYKAYQKLLNSKELLELLEKYDYNLVFYPHIEMQRFLRCFSSENERVSIIGFNDTTVQELLTECDVLITDFSSVFFDFGYMKKPLVYYQFDKEDFRKNHYGEGYFKYERDGFGRVCETEETLLKELEKILQNGAAAEQFYIDKIDGFFGIRDKNNCKRNFDSIIRIAKEQH